MSYFLLLIAAWLSLVDAAVLEQVSRSAAANYNARPAHFVLSGDLPETGPASLISLRVSQSSAQRKPGNPYAAYPCIPATITLYSQPMAAAAAAGWNRYTVRDAPQAVIEAGQMLSHPPVQYGLHSSDLVRRSSVGRYLKRSERVQEEIRE